MVGVKLWPSQFSRSRAMVTRLIESMT